MPGETREIRTFFEYNQWANARFVEVIETLDEDRLTAHLESSFPSVLGTFGHVVGAEWIWLRRFKGENPTAFPDWLVSPRFEALRAKLAEVESEREAWLKTLGDDDLEKVIDYKTLAGTPHRNRLADLCRHVVNHSSYHRGQLTTLLRQVGATPLATDFIVFLREVEAPHEEAR